MSRLKKSIVPRLGPVAAAAVCIAIGSLLLGVGWFVRAATFTEFILLHLGVAFLVGGMVGIGYEFRAGRARFNDQIETLKQAGKELAELKLPNFLKALFPTPTSDANPTDHEIARSHDAIRMQLAELIDGILTIEAEGFKKNVMIRFVEKLLWYASEAAKTLSNVDPGGTGRKLKLPRTAAHLASEILSTQMLALDGDDSYLVISDFTTWANDELDGFNDSMAAIVGDGGNRVVVRRMFAHFGHDDAMELSKARDILRTHWALAAKYPRYELALSVEASYPHIGIFRCIGLPPICFKPGEGGDLSEIEFLRSDETKRFELGWHKAINVRVMSKKGKAGRIKDFDEWCAEANEKNSQFWTRFRHAASEHASR